MPNHARNQDEEGGIGGFNDQSRDSWENRDKNHRRQAEAGQDIAGGENDTDLGEMGENEDPDDDGEGEDGSYGGSEGSDADSDDNDYEVCFVVQDVEFFTFKSGFVNQS